METNINKTIHFEFYGLSGSGKSTISHLVSLKLKKQGYNVIEPTYDIVQKNKVFVRKIKKILSTFSFIICHFSKSQEIFYLIKKNSYHGKEFFRQLFNIVPKIKFYYKSKKNLNYIYIWDEGIIQSAISLSFINNIDSEENFQNLYSIVGNNVIIKKILIYVPKKEAMKRMQSRVTNDSRIEKANSKESANQMLSKMEKLVNLIKIEDGIKKDNIKENDIKNISDEIFNYIIKSLD